jgi:GTPase SAR1 family protein
VFDLTSHESFDNVDRWLQEFRDVARSDAMVVIVGTKSDLIDNRVVTTQEAESYSETPAKSGKNVSKPIEVVVAGIEKNIAGGV